MKLKLIACEVLTREISCCLAGSPHTIDMTFTPKGAHESGDLLRETIQKEIDRTEESDQHYDAILLGYGLCGNGTAGLSSRRIPLVIPRAHDCCTLFLGSRKRFRELFEDNPSRPYSSAGYVERGEGYLSESTTGKTLGLNKCYEDYLALYGEENARFIMESIESTEKDICRELYYIDIPETSPAELREKCIKQAREEGYTVSLHSGSLQLIRNLLDGNWPEEEYLVLQPGKKCIALYDWDLILDTSG